MCTWIPITEYQFAFWIMSLFAVMMNILILKFTTFHVKLIMENKTTIEMLGKEFKPYESLFNLGTERNLR